MGLGASAIALVGEAEIEDEVPRPSRVLEVVDNLDVATLLSRRVTGQDAQLCAPDDRRLPSAAWWVQIFTQLRLPKKGPRALFAGHSNRQSDAVVKTFTNIKRDTTRYVWWGGPRVRADARRSSCPLAPASRTLVRTQVPGRRAVTVLPPLARSRGGHRL